MTERQEEFVQLVWRYYHAHGRHELPWRQPEADNSIDPYKILVSEIMLQQTQVPRVIPKFYAFTVRLPDFETLANAPLSDVLSEWSGLGYNRRAKFLWQAAGMVMRQYGGHLPDALAQLVTLPGVGHNTAGALLAYAYNKPAIFVETNVRTVFMYHFFADQQAVHDADIADLVAQTLPDNPRQWYWALMDYGSHLKQTKGNLNKQSKHYVKQSPFEGSRRQIRGQVLKLLDAKALRLDDLRSIISDERLKAVLDDLVKEELIYLADKYYALAGRVL